MLRSINQSINLHEHVPKRGGGSYTHNIFYSPLSGCYKLYIHSPHIVQTNQNEAAQSSKFIHLFLGLTLGLFPATCPFITLFTRLPSFSIIISLHNSLLLFTCATTASCFNLSLIASFLTHSNLVTPTTPLRTFISAGCNLVLSLSFNSHVTQPYTRGGTTTALYTVQCTLYTILVLL